MSPGKTEATDKKRRRIVTFMIFAILVAAVYFMYHEAHEAAFNNGCSAHMGFLAYLLLDYKRVNGHFPPPVTYNEEGKAMHSWRTIVLGFRHPEYVEGYDFSLPWDSPANLEFARNNVPHFVQYPVDAHGTAPNFMLAIGEGCLYPSRDSKPERRSPPGSTEPVLILVESARDDVLWTEPVDVEGVAETNPFVRPKKYGKHRKRATVLYFKPKKGFQSGTEGEILE